MSELSTRSLVLRQFAALRRQGLDAGTVLRQLGEGLPQGAVRDDCVTAERALAAGQRELGSDFTRLLTDPLGVPEQAETLAEALETRLDAEQALAAPAFTLQIALMGPPLLLAVFGWSFPALFATFEQVPAITAALLSLAKPMRWLGVPLALGLFFAVQALKTRFAPGYRVLTRAAEALQASTRPEAEVNVRAMGFTTLELVLFQMLSVHATSSVALRTIADELRLEGRASVAAFRALAPVIAALAVGSVYLAMLISLYVPIFSIAGAVK